MKNYYNQDITSFVIDFDGRSIDSNDSWIRKFSKSVNDLALLEDSVWYSINANKGKFMKNKREILAKDFASVGFGVDIIGTNHIPPRFPSVVWKKIKETRQDNIRRIFNRNSWGYVKKTIDELKALGIHNKETFNVTAQHSESIVLQKKLMEDSTVEPYLKSKSEVNEKIINKIKKLRKNTLK